MSGSFRFPADFFSHDLGEGLVFISGTLPADLLWDQVRFDQAWFMHPEIKPTIFLHGRTVQIPRWQQAYGADYHFSGQTSHALPIPPLFAPLLDWSRKHIHTAMNALLLNWYEGNDHYIGEHHDSVVSMVHDAPIVTLSFGETRIFRLAKGRQESRVTLNFQAKHGTVFILPQETNAVWKHGVPKSKRYTDRRISLTIRALGTSNE